ncbi:AzlC family ABC transporter permease [Cognatishimia sp. SS12]|uniref:AzlC family ABC transporter permease n=1 Tax=Cognatishimia sp. SS12 TaxID=2979465 RepID=UPI0023315B3E|nr:AzlC family ABC transporter permease [Cognatishimia sp. SS12]MDC0739646.1 AzlC family ABC transporter permease [Cognatishimia sp. SS12]
MSEDLEWRRQARDGVRDAVPIVVAIFPYSAVFGAVAIERGLSLAELLVTSASIYAVASQYVMLDLWGKDVPVWAILLAVFAVNFRHVLYSASSSAWLAGFSRTQRALAFFFLIDPQYASCAKRAAQRQIRPAYYFSYAVLVYSSWMLANFLGGLFGNLIEDQARFGLDMILPMFFASLVFGFRGKSRFALVLATSVSCALLAYLTVGTPWHILLGGGAGMLVAAMTSRAPGTGQGAQHG